jgi:hypothetical protein
LARKQTGASIQRRTTRAGDATDHDPALVVLRLWARSQAKGNTAMHASEREGAKDDADRRAGALEPVELDGPSA